MADLLKCGTHGEREARYVCDHLFQNGHSESPAVMLYYEPEHEEDEPTPAIWCGACEEVLYEIGEINDAFHDFAQFHMVCDFCFQRYLDENQVAETEQ